MRNLGSFFAIIVLATGVTGLQAQTTGEPSKTPSETTVAAASGKETKDERYRIGFQDVLSIQVFKHPELNRRVPVGADGTIVLFRLDKPVVAVCKTPLELAADIQSAYKENYLKNPIVEVVVAEQHSQPIAVIGAVEKPGNFFVSRRVHLLEMLAMAGGPNKESGTRLLVARTGGRSNCKEPGAPEEANVSVIDLKIRDIQEAKTIFWMQPGDVVSVLESDIIYVYGNVNKQGLLKIREPITLAMAITSAEGLKRDANRENVRIFRRKGGSDERTEMIYDLNQIRKGKVIDPILEPGDIVAVSQDKSAAIFFGLADALKASIPSLIYGIP